MRRGIYYVVFVIVAPFVAVVVVIATVVVAERKHTKIRTSFFKLSAAITTAAKITSRIRSVMLANLSSLRLCVCVCLRQPLESCENKERQSRARGSGRGRASGAGAVHPFSVADQPQVTNVKCCFCQKAFNASSLLRGNPCGHPAAPAPSPAQAKVP